MKYSSCLNTTSKDYIPLSTDIHTHCCRHRKTLRAKPRANNLSKAYSSMYYFYYKVKYLDFGPRP